MKHKNKLRVLSIVMLLALVLTACGGGGESSQAGDGGGASATDGGTSTGDGPAGVTEGSGANAGRTDFTYGMTSEPSTLDALIADDFAAYTITHQIYNGLIEETVGGDLIPGLAESWEYNEDNTEITFHLRQGVLFHNGEELTAEDVKYTYDNVIPYGPAQNLTSAMDSMEIIDEYTVVLKLKHAFGPIEYCVAGAQLYIVNKSAREADPDAYIRNPIGTGAYKMVEWRSGDQIILEAFEDYYKGAPAIQTAVFKVVPDQSTAVVALETGEIDMCQPREADRMNLMNNPEIAFYEIEQASTYFITMNNSHGLMTNETLRQAIAHAINKEDLVIGALDGNGSVVHTPMAKDIFGWPADFVAREYNPERAKELLAEAGYPDGLTLTFKTMESASYSTPTEIIQEQLRQIGITVEIHKMERAAFLEDMLTHKDYEISVMSATAFYPDADYIYALYYSDPTEEGRNYHLSAYPELDALLDAARLSADPAEREQLYLEICEFFSEHAVSIPLYAQMYMHACNADLNGFTISPMRRMYVEDLSW